MITNITIRILEYPIAHSPCHDHHINKSDNRIFSKLRKQIRKYRIFCVPNCTEFSQLWQYISTHYNNPPTNNSEIVTIMPKVGITKRSSTKMENSDSHTELSRVSPITKYISRESYQSPKLPTSYTPYTKVETQHFIEPIELNTGQRCIRKHHLSSAAQKHSSRKAKFSFWD